MRIIGYLKQSKVAVALIVVLLIVQAFADLSLPRYTSDLANPALSSGDLNTKTSRMRNPRSALAGRLVAVLVSIAPMRAV